MSDKMKELMVRALSGAFLVAVIVGTLYASPVAFAVVAFVILMFGMKEFYALAGAQGAQPMKILGTTVGIMIFVLAFFSFMASVGHPVAGLALRYVLVAVPAALVWELTRKSKTPAADIGVTLLGVIYVAMPMSLILFLPVLATGQEWNPTVILFIILTVFANDVFAYLAGMTMNSLTHGRTHKMFERISPKKTWEGFAGGIAGAMAMGWAASSVLPVDRWCWLGLSAVIAVAAVAGDLVESMFKRAAGVKDAGRAIPGHGGFLDRFDALLLAVDFAVIYLILSGGAAA
ncbi:MAG: phosphatidate cytidylyltransferase [Alistipes sp.]|nr:phosphatidate cytidylyltransferase [Alistipes sp.]